MKGDCRQGIRNRILELKTSTAKTTTIKVPTELRDRITGVIGVVDRATMAEVDLWLRDFLSLP
ncbi:hypothetical protein CVAR_0907 [Corynebacterium variabile DSM 44702]|uniref:Uncharacterized protein n=1 Tax=Corynebacterium variabile (strain DSM 44702 / CIP 107183 / JCM 12073 / NCIMB 30131) TaxID=858619 RepID=G0HC98_CORVD|nr:hypothetical protein CVAR_0907 [Corynebacterium variabile DSM 44702]